MRDSARSTCNSPFLSGRSNTPRETTASFGTSRNSASMSRAPIFASIALRSSGVNGKYLITTPLSWPANAGHPGDTRGLSKFRSALPSRKSWKPQLGGPASRAMTPFFLQAFYELVVLRLSHQLRQLTLVRDLELEEPDFAFRTGVDLGGIGGQRFIAGRHLAADGGVDFARGLDAF